MKLAGSFASILAFITLTAAHSVQAQVFYDGCTGAYAAFMDQCWHGCINEAERIIRRRLAPDEDAIRRAIEIAMRLCEQRCNDMFPKLYPGCIDEEGKLITPILPGVYYPEFPYLDPLRSPLVPTPWGPIPNPGGEPIGICHVHSQCGEEGQE